MSKERYNLYNEIHKALRADLYETALLLQQTDFHNENNADKAFQKINAVLELFEGHAHHEDKHVMPLVQELDPITYASIESEHETDEALTNQLVDKMDAYMNAASEEMRVELGREIMYLFIEFGAFNLSHMNKEEHLVNEILWKNYTDEALLQISKAIQDDVPPAEMEKILVLMIKGISNLEIIKLLSGIKVAVPAEAFGGIMEMTASLLSEERMRVVKAGLQEEIVLF